MNVRVYPCALQGELTARPSKSEAHRALLCAALCDAQTLLTPLCESEDIIATMRALSALGADVRAEERGMRVLPHEKPAGGAIDCGASGSTLRFILPQLAMMDAQTRVTGCERLSERPVTDLLTALRSNGARIDGNRLPLTVSGGLKSGRFSLRGDVSSQFISALLMALPRLSGDSEIVFTTPPSSRGYIDMTLQTLAHFGIAATPCENGYQVDGRQRFVSPGTLAIGGDWSNAAFFLASGVRVHGLDARSAQPDRAVITLLSAMGGDIDCDSTPDLVPILAVRAATHDGVTTLSSLARLRYKESDRVASVHDMLIALGANARVSGDSLIITGQKRLRGGIVDARGDHRIAMAAAVAAGRCAAPVIIIGAECVAKSYPQFFDDFSKVGGMFDVL